MVSGVFFIESIEILLSVKIVAVRGVSSVMSIFSIVSNALVIASCSAWLLEHLLSSLNLSCTASSVPTKIAIPAPTPCPGFLQSVYAWIVWSLFFSASMILASSVGCCQYFISTLCVRVYVCVCVCMYVCVCVCVCVFVCVYAVVLFSTSL